MNLLRKIKRFVFRKIRDIRSRYYLRKITSKSSAKGVIKVGFIVQMPEIWDKQVDVYEIMCDTPGVEPYLVVVPPYNFDKKEFCKYGEEKTYFSEKYGNVIDAVSEDGKIIDIKKYSFDYVFYQRPYDVHLPKELRSSSVVKFSKVCYIPYGFIGANVFSNIHHFDFYRNVYIGFMDSREESTSLNKLYNANTKKGYQQFVDLGYPVLEKFINMKCDGECKNVLWTPRWSYDENVGGSHFVEYKDEILKLNSLHKELQVTIRPHPLTLPNMIKEGKMTEQDVEKYKCDLKENNVIIDRNEMIEHSISNTDILITDFSSIMVMYFLTGKPMIYCKSELELNDIYKRMLEGVYVANTWEDVEKYIEEICSGNDYLKEIRQEIIETDFKNVKNSAKSIVDYIIHDYNKD